MKRTFTLLAAAFATTAAAQKPYHRDLAVLEVNREAPRTEFVEFASRDEALTRSFEQSDAYRSLDGVWKFRYADDVRTLPADATAADADTSAWSDIRVPGNWELQGHGTPIYVNTRYEYATIDPAPPHLPEAIPAGVYRRTFTVPEAWAGRRIYLTIGGANRASTSMSTAAKRVTTKIRRIPAQYRIDPLLRPGENTLALKMTRWSTGSYLEAQDFWRISGIERTVYLSAETPDALRDFEVVSTLDDSYRTGLFTLKMFLAGDREVEAGYELLDPEGRTVASGRQQATDEALFRAEIPDAAHWTAETPHRYRLVMHVRTPERTVYVPFSVGFRRFEFADAAERDAKGRPYRVLLVNGQPVKFKGVNLHEHDPRTGHYVDEELLLRDMRLMKAHNVNAIRTCHYPQQRRFYELCDSLGFYVYSEANVESHGMGYDLAAGRTLGNDRAWWPAHETRLRNMYMRCRNYPSVSIFSPANESGNGYNFYKAYEWLEAREKGEGRMNRPICYERAQWEWNTDMFVPMYPAAECSKSGDARAPTVRRSVRILARDGQLQRFAVAAMAVDLQISQLAGRLHLGLGRPGIRTPRCSGNPLLDLRRRLRRPRAERRQLLLQRSRFARPHAPSRHGRSALRLRRHRLPSGRAGTGSFEVENRFYFTSLDGYDIVYTVEGRRQSGARGTVRLQTAPQQRETGRRGRRETQTRTELLPAPGGPMDAHRSGPGLPAGTVVAEEQFRCRRALCRPMKRRARGWRSRRRATGSKRRTTVSASPSTSRRERR